MTLDWTGLLALLGLPWALGPALLAALGIGPRDDPWAWPGWCWMAGALTTAAGLCLWLLAGLPLDARWIGASLAALAAAFSGLALRARRRRPAGAPPSATRTGSLFWRAVFALAFCACLVLVCDLALLANVNAVIAGDEAHIWTSKARALWHVGGYGPAYREVLAREYTFVHHPDYPRLNPFLQLWALCLSGESLAVEVRQPIQACQLPLLAILGAAAKRRAHPGLAAVILIAVSVSFTSTDVAARFAVADHLVALGLVAVVDAWWRWQETGRSAYLGLCGIALGFLLWSKNEGQALALALALGALVWWLGAHRPSVHLPRRAWIWVLPPALLLSLHLALNRWLGLENDLMSPSSIALESARSKSSFAGLFLAQFRDRAPVVTRWFGEYVAGARGQIYSSFVCAALFVLFAFAPRRFLASPRLGPPFLAFLASLAAFWCVYVGSHFDVVPHMATSLTRVLYAPTLLAAMLLAAGTGELVPALRGSLKAKD